MQSNERRAARGLTVLPNPSLSAWDANSARTVGSATLKPLLEPQTLLASEGLSQKTIATLLLPTPGDARPGHFFEDRQDLLFRVATPDGSAR